MSSLAELPELVGFFSYSREDDEDSGGRLSKLRERIQAELRGQLGRTKRDFRLWQDKVAIAHGELWEDTIKKGISESVFFIPIITPTAVRSYHCKFEFDSFLAREKELGRSNLVFPILYIPVPALTGDRWRQDPLLSIIGSRQYEQWQNVRQLDPSSTEVALRVEKFCANICRALEQEWLSPQERQEAQARRAAEEERRRQEKLQEEARQRAEEERRREEAATKRRLDEAEAEKRRQDKERRKLEREAAWAAKKEKLHQWRGAAAVGAAAALLLVGVWIVVPPVMRWVAETRYANLEAEIQQLKEEIRRLSNAKADTEAKREVAEAEQQQAQQEAKRLAEQAADVEAKRNAAADAQQQQRLKEESQRLAKEAADANARLKAAETEQQRLKEELQRQVKAAADAEAKRMAAEIEQLRLAVPSTTGLFTIRTNMEAIGSSEDIPRYAFSINDCEQNCTRLGSCKAFSYNKSSGICYRYTQVPPVAPNANFDTGIRIMVLPVKLFDVRTNVGITGGRQLGQETQSTSSVNDCEQKCMRWDVCRAFTLDKKFGRCYLYASGDFLPGKEEFDSGIRK